MSGTIELYLVELFKQSYNGIFSNDLILSIKKPIKKLTIIDLRETSIYRMILGSSPSVLTLCLLKSPHLSPAFSLGYLQI